MHLQSLAALVAVLATTLAAPAADTVAPKKGFTVPRVATGRKILRNGPADVVKTHLKYGRQPPTEVVKAAAAVAVQSGSVSASPEAYNSAYLSPVQYGTPAQTLYMDFDTGSSDLWVFSNYTPAAQRTGHSYYSPGSSSTSSRLNGETWSISYGDGSSSSGLVYADKVVIGGVTQTSQAVEVATTVSSSFVSNTDLDGLVGLGFDTLNQCEPTVCNTFMQNVAPTLPSPIFAAYLKRGTQGAYDFGFLNSAHYTGTINYVSVTPKTYWNVQANGYAVGGGAETASTFGTIVDTGTSLIYLPPAVVSAYYSKVSGARNSFFYGGYVVPCSSTLPSFTIYLGNLPLTVPGTSLNYSPITRRLCYGAIQSDSSIGLSILGDAFINNFYTVFNYTSETGPSYVGFAAQK